MSKTALVTGGAVRIGREIALSLADAGWDIVIHYRHSEEAANELSGLIEGKGRKTYLVQADLQNSGTTSEIIPSLTRKGVEISCLINNASLFEKNNFAELSEANWNAHMNANCFAPLQLIRDFAAQYKGDAGNVINITDGMEGWSMSPVFFSYAMSKHALAYATEFLARTLAPTIRINAIAPGPMLPGVQDKPDTFEKLTQKIPLKRTGTPAEIISALHYILSAPSITGQTIQLSGGLHTIPQWSI